MSEDSRIARIGSIAMIHSVAPNGWLNCDGSAINCSLYGELCALVGNFTPDFTGRFPVGYKSSYAVDMGFVGGEAYHTLTVAEMPSHTHVYYKYGGNSHFIDAGGTGMDHPHRAHSEAEGGSQAHNNLPPFLAVNFIIKT